MDSTTSNVPEAIRLEAKQRALKIIAANQSAISFVCLEELDCQALFVPVITILKAGPDDFHSLGGGVKMPKSYYTNQIAEATGVNILDVRVTKEGEYIWHGHASGERRMPDGTLRHGAQEYEFDAGKRAEEDWLKDAAKYPTDISKRRHVLEYAKFGMQRASSGARLALIRYLAQIPTGFTAETISKAMIFNRVDRNVNGILADPGLRSAAIGHMLGATEAIFGPAKQLEAPSAPEPVAAESEPDPEDTFPGESPAKEPELTPAAKLKLTLQGYLDLKRPEKGGWKTACDLIRAMIADEGATIEAVNNLIDRTESYLQQRKARMA